jgi:hypothetical protein
VTLKDGKLINGQRKKYRCPKCERVYPRSGYCGWCDSVADNVMLGKSIKLVPFLVRDRIAAAKSKIKKGDD